MKIVDKICRAFTFNGIGDKVTTIQKEQALLAVPYIRKNRALLIAEFPKEYTRGLRGGGHIGAKEAVSVLRSILRYHNVRLISIKKYYWDKEKKKSKSYSVYKIIS